MFTGKSFTALAAACLTSLSFSSATAQTVANGPYYATPSWNQQLPVSTRFIVLANWASAAVLDRETGLVWEKSPSISTSDWFNASHDCLSRNTGGRMGWRLPTIQELLSLADRSVPHPGPTLPSGHPFTNVQSSNYWSATARAPNATSAWTVQFSTSTPIDFGKSAPLYAWCVRGGQGVDPQ